MFDPGRCSSRVHDRPFLGGRRALLRGGGCLDACDSIGGWSVFLLSVELQHNFQQKAKRFVRRMFTADHRFPETRKQLDRVTARCYGNCEG